LTQKDILGGKRECWVKSKTYERVRLMNPLFRLCTSGFRERFCGDRNYLADGREISTMLVDQAGCSDRLSPEHADYGFRNSSLVLSLVIVEGGYGEDSSFMAGLHCQWHPTDYRKISLFHFLPAESLGEDRRGMFRKGVRSVTGRATVATSLRNLGTFWQVFSCEEFGAAMRILIDSLLLDIKTWQGVDNALVLVLCARMLSRFFSDLRTQPKSANFPDTPMTCGKESAALMTAYAAQLVTAAEGGDEKRGFSPHPHTVFYDLILGDYAKLQHPHFLPAKKDKTPAEKKKEKETAAKEVKEAKDAEGGGGGPLFKPNGTAVCKAYLCKLLGVKDGNGALPGCTRAVCHFRHPPRVSDITLAEAQAAARVESPDSALFKGLRERTSDGSKGWKKVA
jgi:hypothetical protein